MFTKQRQDKETASDETFAEYFTHVLNPTDADELIIPQVATYWPVLDEWRVYNQEFSNFPFQHGYASLHYC